MILEIILGLFVITLGWTTFNLTRKVERLETWIESYAQRVIDTQDTLKEIDDKGSFEADDEIGVVFQSIKETIDELNEITQEEL
jgi:molybdenum-dependent DNA-binding transcriptional regulator ModE